MDFAEPSVKGLAE